MAAAAALVILAVPVAAAPALPDSTWSLLGALPERPGGPVFALAVNPADAQQVLVGTQSGTIYRSADGGQTWTAVRRDAGHPVNTLAFNPLKPGAVLAGTAGSGVLRSTDGGVTWSAQPGAEHTSARAFGFAKSFTAVGTDQGVFTIRDSTPWTQAGLAQLNVGARAIAAVNDPSRVVAGGDQTRATEPLPLYSSPDGAQSWATVKGVTTGASMVSALAAGPLPAAGTTRPLVMGTNGGLYYSADNAATWQQVTGGGALPAADFTAVAFGTRAERFYAGSDGGGSSQGGLWVTADGGQHFSSLAPPLASVTALAVSGEDQPTLYVAGLRPADGAVFLFRYRDTGGAPQPLSPPLPAPVAALPAQSGAGGAVPATSLLAGPEAPYIALGVAAALVVLLALGAYTLRARSRRL